MTSTEATQLPPGIYRIAVAGVGVDATHATLLTRHGETVTLLPASVHPSSDQEWQISLIGRDGNILIEFPTPRFPIPFLTFGDAPKKPEEHDRILIRLSEFPPNRWHLTIAPGYRNHICVTDSELGIKIGPQEIHPPILELGHKDQLQWVFQRVADASE